MMNRKDRKKGKVLVAMSGGVDSSVAAYLLKAEGYDLTGVTMCLGIKDSGDGKARCCGGDAVEDAKKVCDRIGIPHYVLDFAEAMEEKVIGKFVSEYRRGRTPNPCIDCNEYLKFGLLLDQAKALGFDYLATGHYAVIERGPDGATLKKPKDRKKDQTYFLYGMGRSSLDAVLFPLGTLAKDEVRKIAVEAGLPVAGKPESQDICFVGRKEMESFFSERIKDLRPGPITDRTGRTLGIHRGIAFYTIGQRGGLGISHPTPLYVIEIDPRSNRIVVGEKGELRARGLITGHLKELSADWPERAQVKIRYRKKEIECRISKHENKLTVLFDEEQEAVTPGQSAVFYEGETVLGGAIIEGAIDGTQ
jgi:tRNA-uridine 2-sulfurtransferase